MSHIVCGRINSQSGSLPRRDTETGFHKVAYHLFLPLIRGHMPIVAIVRISSAFDTVDPFLIIHCPYSDIELNGASFLKCL